MLSEEMIEKAEWKAEIVAEEKEVNNEECRKSSCGVEYMLCTMAPHTGKWDEIMFQPTLVAYQ